MGLITPFAALLWVMLLKLVLGGDVYKNNVRPGVYPKWSRMHLRIWWIGRMESTVLRSAGCDVSQRTADRLRRCGSSARRSATIFSAPRMPLSPGPWI